VYGEGNPSRALSSSAFVYMPGRVRFVHGTRVDDAVEDEIDDDVRLGILRLLFSTDQRQRNIYEA